MNDRGTPRFAGAPPPQRRFASRSRRVLTLAIFVVASVARVAVAQTPGTPAPAVTPGDAPAPNVAVTPGGAPPASAPLAPAVPPPAPAPAPGSTEPGGAEAPGNVPPGFTTPGPDVTPTQPPIIVEPPAGGVLPGGFQTLRVESALGTIAATVANPALLDVRVDQDARTFTIEGRAIGATVVTIRDERGQTRDVPVRIAEIAGSVPDAITLRITGDPATPAFIAERAVAAAVMAVRAKPGATVVASQESVKVKRALPIDDVEEVDVPVIVQGDAYFTTQGLTHVRVENQAEPTVSPASLLVSDFPETLKANGMLFTADLSSAKASRFLYYHYNPKGQPDRRIVLLAENSSDEPAKVQFISGAGGPDANEQLVGHASTQRFLVRLLQNEGTVITLPPHATQAILAQALPAGSVVSNLLQLHEISGATLHLTLVAQNASDPRQRPRP